jgi:uncharacterized protein (TIGR01440 family)
MDVVRDTQAVLTDLFEKIHAEPGSLLVLGMSTSEVMGERIGSASAPEVGQDVVRCVLEAAALRGIDVAVQCCEHLNRALVMEKDAAARRGYERVSVVPHPRAGGGAATAAYAQFAQPVVVESVRADVGMDVGVTMIGMHMRPVVVPVHCALTIGSARVDFCVARPKLIGGERARYA